MQWYSNIVPIRISFCKQTKGNTWSGSRQTNKNGWLRDPRREELRCYDSFISRTGALGTHDSVASDEDGDILQQSSCAHIHSMRYISALEADWVS